MKTETLAVDSVRILNEGEIQRRLYGGYRPRSPGPSAAAASDETVWTGSEILAGEVQRLRSELMALRKEKSHLESQMEKMQGPAPSGAGWLGRLLGLFVLVGLVGYLLSVRMPQASPAGLEATPYTVQVAVYDGSQMAQRAEGFLKELGYDAFLVETPRGNGQTRFRVYVGSFVTQEEARLESDRLASDRRFQDFKDAFVRVR